MLTTMMLSEQLLQETQMAVIVNAGSGTDDKDGVEQRLVEAFAAVGLHPRIFVARDGAELLKLGERAMREGAETLVAGGGDGTISAVASIVAGTDKPLGVLPLATLNHFAKALTLPLDLTGAIRN